MTTKMLRLPALAHERAVALAQLTGRSIGTVVSEAIDRAYREAFWETVERQTAQTREQDPASWAQYRAEAIEWDEATDSLDEDDVPAIRSDAVATRASAGQARAAAGQAGGAAGQARGGAAQASGAAGQGHGAGHDRGNASQARGEAPGPGGQQPKRAS